MIKSHPDLSHPRVMDRLPDHFVRLQLPMTTNTIYSDSLELCRRLTKGILKYTQGRIYVGIMSTEAQWVLGFEIPADQTFAMMMIDTILQEK
jgi:hypothetical protein